jgi:plastocyanin
MRRLFVVLALSSAPGAQAAEEHLVAIRDATYTPARIEARVGDSIRFVNRDPVDHEVFVPTVGHAVDLGKQEPGKETGLVLARPGRFEVECVFHPEMLLTVEVVP